MDKYIFTKYGNNLNEFTVKYPDGVVIDFNQVNIEFVGISPSNDDPDLTILNILTTESIQKLKLGITNSLEFISFVLETKEAQRILMLLTIKAKEKHV